MAVAVSFSSCVNPQVVNNNTYTASAINLASATMLVVGLAWQSPSNVPTSVTYGGTALTAISGTLGNDTGTNTSYQIFWLASPASGSNSLVVNGSNLGQVYISVVGLTGTGTTLGSSAKSPNISSAHASATASLTGVSTSSVILGFEDDYSSSAVSPTFTGFTALQSITANNASMRSYTNTSPTSGANSFTFTSTQSGYFDVTAVEVLAGGATNQTITSDSRTSTFSLGAMALALAISASSLTATFSSPLETLSLQVNASPTTAAFSVGPEVASEAITASTLTGVYSLGTTTITEQVTADPATATFTIGSVTLAQSVTASSLVSTLTFGAESVSQAVTADPATATFTVTTTAAVIEPQTITSTTLTSTISLGDGIVSSNPVIVEASLNAAFSLGASTVVGTAAPSPIIASPLTSTMSFLGEVVSEPPSLLISDTPLTATLSIGAASLAIPSAQSFAATPVTASYTLPTYAVTNTAAPSVTSGALSAVMTAGALIVTPAAPPSVSAAPLIATFSLPNALAAVATAPTVTLNVQAASTMSLGPVAVLHSLTPITVQLDSLFGVFVAPTNSVVSVNPAYTPTTGHLAVFQVLLDKLPTDEATVTWFTLDDTAVAPFDYTQSSGTLEFPPGVTSGVIEVAFPSPRPGASTKQFDVVLSSPSGCVVFEARAVCVLPAGASLPTVFSISDALVTSSAPVTTPVVAGPLTISALSLGVSATLGGGSLTQPIPAMTYLKAIGSRLYDALGKQFVPRSIDWYGMENILTPIGIFSRAYKSITTGGTLKLGILDQIAGLGFNSIRFQICEDITWTTSGPPSSSNVWTPANGRRPISATGNPLSTYIDPVLNPDFMTTTTGDLYSAPQPFISSLEMLDKIIAYCATIGLRVFLDMHCLAPNSSDQLGDSRAVNGALDTSIGANGLPNWINTKLWYTTVLRTDAGQTAGVVNEYRSEAQIIQAWTILAARYAGQPAMAGCDLINEPAGGTWDTLATANLATNLPSFYERCGASMLAVNPDILIICEGPTGNVTFPNTAAGEPQVYGTLFSSKLDNVVNRQVGAGMSAFIGKVVYSPHEYGSYAGASADSYTNSPPSFQAAGPAKNYAHQWFYDPTYPANMAAIWRTEWGYISENDIAPVWVGEIGADLQISTAVGYTANHVATDQAWLTAFKNYVTANHIGFSWFAMNPNTAGNPLGLTPLAADGFTWSTTENAWQMTYITPMLTAPVT